MPKIGVHQLRQTAVLWPFDGNDGNGDPKRGTAEQVRVRWEQTKDEVLGPEQTPVAIDVTVFIGKAVAENSTMWLGALADLPGTLVDLFIVALVEDTPDIKNRSTLRKLGLIRQGQ